MENLIQKHRAFVASQIEKSFNINIQSDEVDIEKAHKDGDMHPNGKWVWVQTANGGKGDWRVAGARTHKNASAGAIPSSDVKPVTAKEFSKNKNAVVEMLKNCDSKTDSNGDKRYHCEFYALGKDRGSAWFKKSDIEAYLRSYDDAKITPIKSDNASKEHKFKQSFKDASDNVLQKVVDGKIQASSEEKKWAQDILDERKASDVKTKASKKIIDLLKVASSKYTDISKVVAWKTDRGNYYLDYDGAETGITVDKDVLSDKDFENAGVKVEGDSKSNASSNDPRDKQAQEAGFKDYAELRAWQDYGTAKSLLKKKSTNDSLRKQLQDKVAKYEKEHADVIKRVAEKKDGKKVADGYSSMDIKDAKKALVGKVVTLADYWPDGRGGSQDAIGEIKNVRLYGKNKTPIAEVVYPNGDEQLIRLDEIDDGKMKDSYKTAITIGDDKTKLDAIKKKISNNA